MKLESAYFDKIRTRREPQRPTRASLRLCEAEGCSQQGEYRAPKGRQAEGEYFWFCLDHVRAYNKTYNYFSGMDDEAIQAYQKAASIGHRPTWKVGGAHAEELQPPGGRAKFGWQQPPNDPFEILGGNFRTRAPEREEPRGLRNMERKSLQTLGLDETATPAEIKAQFKLLVKRHHPDLHGGDRSLEDKLREIIQAYNYLKSVGFC